MDLRALGIDPALAPANAAAPEAANLGRDAFLQLFVTQLRNQDPLQPQDNEAFLAQLAQFSSLELLENLSSDFQALTSFEQVSQASALLGKDIRYTDFLDGSEKFGRVDSVRLDSGRAILRVGEDEIDYSAVSEILEPTEEEEE